MNEELLNIKIYLNQIISKLSSLNKKNYNKNGCFNDILLAIHENQKGCEMFINEVQLKDILPSVYIKPISNVQNNINMNRIINILNNKIQKLDNILLTSNTYKDIQKFLNQITSIKRYLKKLRDMIFDTNCDTGVQKAKDEIKDNDGDNLQRGGGIDETERDLTQSIILNTNIVEKLNNIASLLEIITANIVSDNMGFDCLSISKKMNNNIKNFNHYRLIHKTINDMIDDPAHSVILSDVIKDNWFIQLTQIIKSRNWDTIDLSDENIQNWKSDKCTDIMSMTKEYETFLSIVPKLVNLYEDMKGAVRILVRFNNITNKVIKMENYINVDYVNKTLLSKRNKINVQGIYSIYDNLTNQQMYLSPPFNQEALKGTFDQLRDGYSNFIFGYGYSGSGKTYTLYGKTEDVGMIQFGLNDLITDGYKIELIYAFDIYGFMKYTTSTGLVIDSSIIHYITPNETLSKNIEIHQKINSEIISPTKIDKTNLYSVFNNLNQFRIKNKSIKETINNPESSRGHLFLTFEITKNDKKSYLTVIDMAGIEDPLAIIGFYFEHLSPNNGNSISNILACVGNDDIKGKGKLLEWKKIISKAHPKGLEYTDAEKKNVYQIIREGFFINETIHHLKAFLLEKQGVIYKGQFQQGYNNSSGKIMFLPDKYNKDNIFIKPNTREAKSILIYNTLKYLSEMTKTQKQSKFIMMSVIRSDRTDEATNDIKFLDETLNYVNQFLSK